MMDPKMEEQMMSQLEEMGISKDKIDDHLMWGAKKMMFGMMKVLWSLKENGVSEAEAKEIVAKMMAKMADPKMMAKMSEIKSDKMDWHGYNHMHSKGCGCQKDEDKEE